MPKKKKISSSKNLHECHDAKMINFKVKAIRKYFKHRASYKTL